MKNKVVIIVVFMLICFLCIHCFTDTVNDGGKKNEIVEETNYFRITRSDFQWYYHIFDKNHNIVKSGGPLDRQPEIMLIENKFVRFTLQTGTGISTQWGFFYDIDRNEFSEIFQSIYDQNNGKVVYGGLNKVIVSNIFDNDKYLEISTFKNSLSEVADPIVRVKFIGDGNSIEISYISGDNHEEVTEIIDLRNR